MSFCALFHAIKKSNGVIEICFKFFESVSRINYNPNAPGNQQFLHYVLNIREEYTANKQSGLETVLCFDAYSASLLDFCEIPHSSTERDRNEVGRLQFRRLRWTRRASSMPIGDYFADGKEAGIYYTQANL